MSELCDFDDFDPPEKIYLQPGMGEEGETTWCEDQIGDDNPVYIRADKVAALEAENARLREALTGLRKAVAYDLRHSNDEDDERAWLALTSQYYNALRDIATNANGAEYGHWANLKAEKALRGEE